LQPVENDPYAVNLTPVDHDPYAVNLQPVDYNPWTALPTPHGVPQVTITPSQADMPISPYTQEAAGRGAQAVGEGMVNWAATPGAQLQPNPYPPGSEEAQWYEDQRSAQASQWGPETAMMMVGGGGPGAEAGAALGSGIARDPRLWHGISQVKLPKPIEEMTPTIQSVPVTEKTITPSDLQGGLLLPAIGDRSAASGTLTGFNGYNFNDPVQLQGGHGYMAANSDRGAVWASNKGVISQLENKARVLAEMGDPVYFPYTAMGERSVDFSHHVSDALSAAIPQSKITPANIKLFDQAMVTDAKDFPADKNWPGVGSPSLREYLQSASGNVRNKFAKTMDTAAF
jgi:hypothetical protein